MLCFFFFFFFFCLVVCVLGFVLNAAAVAKYSLYCETCQTTNSSPMRLLGELGYLKFLALNVALDDSARPSARTQAWP